MVQRKIQQQYFTRDREGIFRTSEGFDTIAKSPSLDNTFIKAILHPYCVYKAPQELLSRDESDSSAYPESFLVFQTDNGDMVIGRSIYIGTDFTGQRSASFTHQYIVPKELKETFLREPNRLFRIRDFQSSYDIQYGKSIPEVNEIAYDWHYDENEQERLLNELRIDSKRFQQLLYAIMSSTSNKKKVYIALDTGVSESSEKAKRLLEIIYRCIPYAFRRQLGFMTFNSEPESKQNIHVVFVEKGSMRLPDRRIEKDYLFDFPNQKFINTDIPENEQPLLDFVWHFRHESEPLQGLFDFSEEALQDSELNIPLSVSTYSQLLMLYEIEQGDETLYEQNRSGSMNSILSFLNKENVRNKPRLRELFIRLLRKDATDGGSLPTAGYIQSLLDYYVFAEEGEQALLVQCFVIFVNRASSRSEEGISGAARLFEPMLTHSSKVLGLVMRELQKQSSNTAEQYMSYRMNQVGTVDTLLAEIDFWLAQADELVQARFFVNEVLQKSKQLLQKTGPKRIDTAAVLYRYFEQLPQRSKKKQNESFSDIIKLELQLELLAELNVSSLSYDDVTRLGFMVDPIDSDLFQHMEKSKKQTVIVLGLLYRLLMLKPEEEAEAFEALQELGSADLERVQEALKRLLADRIDSSRFSPIVFAFYVPDAEQSFHFTAGYDYDGMLEYIAANMSDTDTMYDFLLKSAGDRKFLDEKGVIQPSYKAAVIRYFDIHDARAFRNKSVREKLLNAANPSFIALFQAIKLKQSGKWVRFFVRNKRKLVRSSLIAVPVLAILLFLLWTPLLNWFASFGPPPEIVVDALPETSTTMNLTIKASVKGDKTETVKMYLNGQYVANGAIDTTVALHDGENLFEFTAVNRGGTSSEVIQKKVMYAMPSPTITYNPIPETSKTAAVTISASAKDANDTSPTIYINGQAVGQSTVSWSMNLSPGDNTVEIKAGNKFGKMSDTIKKIIKYTPTAATTTATIIKK
ncbi:GAP1-N2 domain-containing protein [Paenibacillus sp. UNC451MF]|uniref:GAP1-N2 domain-containing protein n=1 Tax=Paenibacillus sp. UNC451MF TaxID=1449063 RepID=UPI00068D144A|nr:cadherin-like beta sandwich domain-containing protein [Paenibacillus sp. UNC451MF]